MIKVTYVFHSCYVVELKEIVLIFDYYKGIIPSFDSEKPVYIFVSHMHYDHYQKEIFHWKNNYKNTTYVLSDDITDSGIPQDAIILGVNEKRKVDKLNITTLRSTDEGVAFLIKYNGMCIYHGGDLNWWHWIKESSVHKEMMKRKYQYEISKLKDEKIDIAFVPMDGKLKEAYGWGMDYFLEHTTTKAIFPMHFDPDHSVISKYKKSKLGKNYKEIIYDVLSMGETFLIKEEEL